MPQQPMQGAAPEHPKAQTVFILGIIGAFVPLIAWIAWFMGGKAKKEIAAGAPYEWGGKLKNGHMLGKFFGIVYIVFGVLYGASMGCYIVSTVMANS